MTSTAIIFLGVVLGSSSCIIYVVIVSRIYVSKQQQLKLVVENAEKELREDILQIGIIELSMTEFGREVLIWAKMEYPLTDQLISLLDLPTEKFDRDAYYSLLFLLENELRRLTAYMLETKDPDKWHSRIPPEIQERVFESADKGASSYQLLEHLDLGSIFKVILREDNWNDIFKPVFLSLGFLENRMNLILGVRNKIAHFAPIDTQSGQEFAVITQQLIRMIRPYTETNDELQTRPTKRAVDGGDSPR